MTPLVKTKNKREVDRLPHIHITHRLFYKGVWYEYSDTIKKAIYTASLIFPHYKKGIKTSQKHHKKRQNLTQKKRFYHTELYEQFFDTIKKRTKTRLKQD